MTKRAVGDIGEEIAAEYLISRGFHIVDRNVVRHRVEADILAREGKTWVIVEVKTKYGHEYGLPQEMVGPHKQQQLRRFANSLISEHGEIAVRIDVVAVTLARGEEPQIEHLVNVVEG